MSGYNDLFDFNSSIGAHDIPGSLNAEPAPTMDQSGNWNAASSASSGLMEGGTAAQLHARLDFAPFEGARSIGQLLVAAEAAEAATDFTCATCFSTFQTAFALDNHAKEATHQAYKCKCGTDFNKHSALKRHIATKDAPKTFACTLCSDKFTRKDKVKDHCRHYHRVTDEGLRNLFSSQEVRPRAAASRRHREPVPLAAASPASASTLAPAIPPAVVPTPTPAGPAVWSFAASTGQQDADFLTGPSIPAGPLVPANPFDLAADFFAAAPTPSEDISGLAGGFLGDEAWATVFDDFNF